MKIFGMQPGFSVDLEIEPERLQPSLRAVLRTEKFRDTCSAAGSVADFRVAEAQRRFWSPHLGVQIASCEVGSRLHCRFSPRPEVWTMVVMSYFVMVFLTFVGGIWGYVQWSIAQPPWALLCIPIGLISIGGLHVVSLIGQSWSRDQMDELRIRMHEAMVEASRTRD